MNRFMTAAIGLGLLAGMTAAAVAAPLPVPLATQGTQAPIAASASITVTPGVAISDHSYVPAGEIHEGDLVSILGDVVVDGEVTGSVVVVLGSVTINGHVHGELVSVLSRSRLGEEARVDSEFVSVGWSPIREPGSVVEGEVVNINFMNLVPFAGHGGGLRGLLRFLMIWHLIKLAFLFIILLVITALMPRRLATMAAAFPTRWGWSFLVGLLTYAGVLIGAIFLAITLIGLPVALVLWFVAKMLKWVGLAALFYLMGNSMGRNLFRRDLPHLASVLAGFVLYAAMSLVPILGSAFGMVMSILALGLVLVTRFGSVAMPVAARPAAGPAPQGPPGAGAPGPSTTPGGPMNPGTPGPAAEPPRSF